jgi:hypothetical protein
MSWNLVALTRPCAGARRPVQIGDGTLGWAVVFLTPAEHERLNRQLARWIRVLGPDGWAEHLAWLRNEYGIDDGWRRVCFRPRPSGGRHTPWMLMKVAAP